MPYIDVISYEASEGELRNIYDELIEKRGKLAEIHKIQSLHPTSITAHMDLYLKIMFGRSPLKRYQREMIGVVVSAANECRYCVEHHAAALQHFWKDKEKVRQLCEDYRQLEGSRIDRLLCDLAWSITKAPGFPFKESLYFSIRSEGINDRGILDANLVAAYFNFVNRLVLGLGVDLEENYEGYRYD